MLFWTIVFLAYWVVVLVKGRLFKNVIIEAAEEEIKKQKLGVDRYKFENTELGVKVLGVLLLMIPIVIGQVFYLTKAISIDQYYYPSVVGLAYLLLGIVISLIMNTGKKVDLSSDEKVEKYRKKATQARTVKGTLGQLFWVVYFGYMLLTLMGVLMK